MSLKIGVLVKYVPDSTAKIEVQGGELDLSSVKWSVNPYDEFAVEEAIKTKEAWTKSGQEVETVGILLGPKTARKGLTDVLAVGLDRGLHIIDDSNQAPDNRSISTALANVCKEEGFHLIFAGKQAIDTDSHATSIMVAERLGLPHVGVVSKIEWENTESAKVERDVDGGQKEIFSVKLPALFSCNKGLNKMRMASFINIRKAAQKPVKEIPLEGVSPSWTTSQWELPPERGAVKMIDGDNPEAQVEALLKALREEAKVV